MFAPSPESPIALRGVLFSVEKVLNCISAAYLRCAAHCAGVWAAPYNAERYIGSVKLTGQ